MKKICFAAASAAALLAAVSLANAQGRAQAQVLAERHPTNVGM